MLWELGDNMRRSLAEHENAKSLAYFPRDSRDSAASVDTSLAEESNIILDFVDREKDRGISKVYLVQ